MTQGNVQTQIATDQIIDAETTPLLLNLFEAAVNPDHFPKFAAVLEQWLSGEVNENQLQNVSVYSESLWKSLTNAHKNIQLPFQQSKPIAIYSNYLQYFPEISSQGDIVSHFFPEDYARLKAWIKNTEPYENIFRWLDENQNVQYCLCKLEGDRFNFYEISDSINSSAKKIISECFHVTNTEMLVLEQLLLGHSIKDIANESRKSVETIRSQIKSISIKLRVSRQQEIVSLVRKIDANTRHISGQYFSWTPASKTIILSDGRHISYRIYGAQKGRIVLCMHNFTSASHLPRKSQTEFENQNLKWIVPARAGYGHSSPVYLEGQKLLDQHVRDYVEILSAENVEECVILANGMSISIAALLASQLKDRVKYIFGLDVLHPVMDRQSAMAFRSGMFRSGALASLYTPTMLKLLTRFVIAKALTVANAKQLRELSGDTSQFLMEEEEDGFQEYFHPNIQEIMLGKAEGAWRDCTYLHFPWHEYVPKETIILQHFDFPYSDIEFLKAYCEKYAIEFFEIPAHYRKIHLQMAGLSDFIASRW